MYVPQSLHFAEPMFTLWRGRSGRTYEFAVLSPESLRIGAPVVFVLARQQGGRTEPLFVGHADTLGTDDGLRAKWIAAREMGMTHVHASFDALWQPARVAQVEDLIAALSPPLNKVAADADAEARAAAPVYRLPVASIASLQPPSDAASTSAASPSATASAGRPAVSELAKVVAPSSPPQRRITLPSERLWAMARAAGRAIEKLVTRGRRREKRPPAADVAGGSAAAPLPPVTSMPEAAARTDSLQRIEPIERTKEPQPPPPFQEAPRDDAEAIPTQTIPAEAIAAEAVPLEATPPEAGARAEPIEHIRSRLRLPSSAPVILFAGHMGETSGIEILIDAIITVASGDPHVHFVLAGSGARREVAEARAAATHLGSRCRFTGDLDADTCRDYLAAADCVVVPAHAPVTDAFADAALAAGKPVLTTHQAQLPAVSHGVNGLVAYDNPNSLVWGLRELLSMRAEHRLFFEPPSHAA